MDVVVAEQIVLEIKAVEKLIPLYQAQLLTYLRLARYPTGLLMNFHSVVLKDGLRRLTNPT